MNGWSHSEFKDLIHSFNIRSFSCLNFAIKNLEYMNPPLQCHFEQLSLSFIDNQCGELSLKTINLKCSVLFPPRFYEPRQAGHTLKRLGWSPVNRVASCDLSAGGSASLLLAKSLRGQAIVLMHGLLLIVQRKRPGAPGACLQRMLENTRQ